MNKWQSSKQTRSIKILVNDDENDVSLSTQLDDESTVRILKVCLENMQDKTSRKVVPIGKDRENEQKREK